MSKDESKRDQTYSKPAVEKRVKADELQREAKYAGDPTGPA